jgi:7-cyano-7-deazaguanine reductase
MPAQPSKILDSFPNPNPERDYIIEIEAPEFTCLCPKTGQPDFATLHLEYVPDRLCVELKSFKLYIWSYRNEGHFHEDVTNRMLNDLVAAIAPRYLRLQAEFNVRGGVYTTVTAEHRQAGWNPPPPPPDLPRVRQELPDSHTDAPPGAAAPEPAAAAPAAESLRTRFRMLRRSRRGPATETPETTASRTAGVRESAGDRPPPAPKKPPKTIFLGIDLGTTGCRAAAIDVEGTVLAEAHAPIPAPLKNNDQITQDPTQWWKAVTHCLESLLAEVNPAEIHTLAVDGTSGTLLLTDDKGAPVTPAILYNDRRAEEEAKKIATLADAHSGAQGATSSLAKLLWLQHKKIDRRAAQALHQADWIGGRFTGAFGHSDYNNCLKLGFDQEKLVWPSWLGKLGVNTALLPQVHPPGEVLGPVSAEIAKVFGLTPDTLVAAGTTDGVAAFLAAGATRPGHGVTSLGTTLVLKLLSDKPVFSPNHGVYSHRLGNYWLAGGASNSGGAVLLQYFDLEQMREMTPLLDPENPTGLDYYPLPDVGERFPVNDPAMTARLEPLPADSVMFFQGLLEGIAGIEAQGYRLLEKLGAPKLTAVWTTGGGAENPAWERIRERALKMKMQKARSGLAAAGAALLAAGVVAKNFQ